MNRRRNDTTGAVVVHIATHRRAESRLRTAWLGMPSALPRGRQALSRRDEEDAVGTVEGSQHGLEPAVATVEQIRGCNRDSLAQARGVDRPTTEPRLERPQQEPRVLERPARDAATLFAGLQLDD